MVYLDYAASFPPYSQAMEEMMGLSLELYGNAGGIHSRASQLRAILQQSRRTLAELLKVQPQELFFTSGGTESCNWAIKRGIAPGKRHIIVSGLEHKAVLRSAESMKREGYSLTVVDADEKGLVSLARLEAAVRPDTGLIAVQAVNNETGVMQDVESIAEMARSRRIPYFCDGVQSFGHVSQPLGKASYTALSAHKLGGPVGIGALVVRQPYLLPPLMDGGGQELGRRAGTENIPAIAAFALAARLSCENLESEETRLAALGDSFIELLHAEAPGMEINGAGSPRQPGIINCFFPGISAEELAMKLDRNGICCSPGAACGARDGKPSHVLLSMGLGEDRATRSLRFSMGRDTGLSQLEYTAHTIGKILRKEI